MQIQYLVQAIRVYTLHCRYGYIVALDGIGRTCDRSDEAPTAAAPAVGFWMGNGPSTKQRKKRNGLVFPCRSLFLSPFSSWSYRKKNRQRLWDGPATKEWNLSYGNIRQSCIESTWHTNSSSRSYPPRLVSRRSLSSLFLDFVASFLFHLRAWRHQSTCCDARI